jgi:hypothetical protein
VHRIDRIASHMHLSLFRIATKIMKEDINIWGITEYEGEGDGEACPIIPANLPWYKKIALTFFRFGVCPLCITMSLAYALGGFVKRMVKG